MDSLPEREARVYPVLLSLLAVLLGVAGCVGRQWPPPPVPQRLVIEPGEYILAGTVRDRPFAARLTLSADEYALRQEDALCRGRSAVLAERADSLLSWVSCRELRYVLRFEAGRPSAAVAYARGSVCIRRDAAGNCIRRRPAGEAEVALTIEVVPAHAQTRDDLIPVDVLERARNARWHVRAFDGDGTMIAEGAMGTTGDEFTIGGQRLAEQRLSRLERRVVNHQRVWLAAVLGGAASGLIGTQFTQGGDAAARTQDVALIGAFIGGGAAAGGLLAHLTRRAPDEWQVIWQR